MTSIDLELEQELELELELHRHPLEPYVETLVEGSGVEISRNPTLSLGRRGPIQTVYLTAARPLRRSGLSQGSCLEAERRYFRHIAKKSGGRL